MSGIHGLEHHVVASTVRIATSCDPAPPSDSVLATSARGIALLAVSARCFPVAR